MRPLPKSIVRLATTLALLSGAACQRSDACEGPYHDLDSACGCPPERLLGDGTCCRGMTTPIAGNCGARTWDPPQTSLVIGGPGASAIEIEVDARGEGLVSWVERGDSQQSTHTFIAQQNDGYAPLQLGPDLPGFGSRAALASGPAGEAIATWTQFRADGGVVYLATRSSVDSAADPWAQPSADTPLSLAPRGSASRAVLSTTGEALVTWNQGTANGYGVAIAIRAADADAGTRSAPLDGFEGPRDNEDVLSPPIQFSNSPQIAIAENGDALIAWYQSPALEADLAVFVSARPGATNSFLRPGVNTAISPPGGPVASHRVRNPFPTIGEFGNGAVVWAQHSGEATRIYLATRDGFGRWTVPQSIDDALSPQGGRAACPQTAIGQLGELFIVWQHDQGNGSQIYAAHRNQAGVFDEPGDEPTLLSSEAAIAVEPQLELGPDGEAVVVWAEVAMGGRWRVMSRHRNADASRWSTAVQLSVSTADEDALLPTLDIGPSGRVLAGWQQGPADAMLLRVLTMR